MLWVGSRVMGRAGRLSWVAVMGGMALAASLGVACDGGSGRRGARRPAPSARERAAVVKVVEQLRSNDASGFDPASWAAAADHAAVIPTGGKLTVDAKTSDVRDDTASVDATLSVPGGASQREWLFLHKANGVWLVYASLPLETAESPTPSTTTASAP